MSFVLVCVFKTGMFVNRLYAKIFPITSTRRFVADQVVRWVSFLTILLVGVICFVGVCYFMGYVGMDYFQMKCYSGNVMTVVNGMYVCRLCLGVMMFSMMAFMGILLMSVVVYVYYNDYLPWVDAQGERIRELEDGVVDEEAIYVPVVTNIFQRVSYMILPLGSLVRYFMWLIVRLAVFVVMIYGHVYLSLKTFPFGDGVRLSWSIKWMISTFTQAIVSIVVFILYVCIGDSCSDEWKKFVHRRDSAIDHKN